MLQGRISLLVRQRQAEPGSHFRLTIFDWRLGIGTWSGHRDRRPLQDESNQPSTRFCSLAKIYGPYLSVSPPKQRNLGNVLETEPEEGSNCEGLLPQLAGSHETKPVSAVSVRRPAHNACRNVSCTE